HYSVNSAFFSTAVTNGPLTALADGTDGPNGVYTYSGTSIFPSATYNAGNYWVDVVFNQTDTPSVAASAPTNGATNVSVTPSITATFNEGINATTLTSSSVQVLDPSN